MGDVLIDFQRLDCYNEEEMIFDLLLAPFVDIHEVVIDNSSDVRDRGEETRGVSESKQTRHIDEDQAPTQVIRLYLLAESAIEVADVYDVQGQLSSGRTFLYLKCTGMIAVIPHFDIPPSQVHKFPDIQSGIRLLFPCSLEHRAKVRLVILEASVFDAL